MMRRCFLAFMLTVSFSVPSLALSAKAEAMGACDWAAEIRADARVHSYEKAGRYVSAAESSLLAANLTNGCETGRGSMVSAYSLQEAGLCFWGARRIEAALMELRLSQTMFTMVVSVYPEWAEDAQKGYDGSQSSIDAIEKYHPDIRAE